MDDLYKGQVLEDMINSEGGKILMEYADGKLEMLQRGICKAKFENLHDVYFQQGYYHALYQLKGFIDEAIKKKNQLIQQQGAE